MGPQPGSANELVTTLLVELEAARARLAHAQGAARGGQFAFEAAALSNEVERLCREAAMCDDERRAEDLLVRSQERLLELQKLIGVH